MRLITRFALVLVLLCFASTAIALDKVVVIPLMADAPDPIPTVTSSTGKVWMDRNIGASRKAQGSADVQAYGHLFQWG